MLRFLQSQLVEGFEVCLTSLVLVTEYDAFIHFRFSLLKSSCERFPLSQWLCRWRRTPNPQGLLVLFQQLNVRADHFLDKARAVTLLSTK
jgi:hypothetical protein